MTPVFKQDRRSARRRMKKRMEKVNYSPFTQGSYFG